MELTELQLKELEQTQYLEIEDTKTEKIRDERLIIHFISTPDLDRGRDIMNPKGMISDGFDKQKTIFIDHNYSRPLGKNKKLLRTAEGVKATSYFSNTTQDAIDRYNLHVEGVVNGWSIGFGPVRDKTGKIKEGSISFDEKTGVRTFNEWELMEYSSTGIPMNTDAIDLAKSICKSMEHLQQIEYAEVKMTLEGFKNSDRETRELIKSLETALQDKVKDYDTIKEELKNIQSKLEKNTLASVNRKTDYDLIRKIARDTAVGIVESVTGKKPKF